MEIINDFLGRYVIINDFGQKIKAFDNMDDAYDQLKEWEGD